MILSAGIQVLNSSRSQILRMSTRATLRYLRMPKTLTNRRTIIKYLTPRRAPCCIHAAKMRALTVGILVACATLASVANARPTGAPTEACSTLTPNHPDIIPLPCVGCGFELVVEAQEEVLRDGLEPEFMTYRCGQTHTGAILSSPYNIRLGTTYVMHLPQLPSSTRTVVLSEDSWCSLVCSPKSSTRRHLSLEPFGLLLQHSYLLVMITW